MDFPGLIADFAARHNVAGLAAEDGAAALDIDGILVTLLSSGDRMDATAEIGEPPLDGAADFADLLLEASRDGDAVFVKDRTTGRYRIIRRMMLPALDPLSFDEALSDLVTLAETWRRRLADFRPATESDGENTDLPAFGPGGFMQV